MLLFAIIFITLALIFYTIGVWSEKLQKTLKPWHLLLFWIGFICDTLGTSAMSNLVGDTFSLSFHGVTGAIAILLMLFHAIWATVVIRKNDDVKKAKFHRLSIVVWFVWLIPMLSGVFFGMYN